MKINIRKIHNFLIDLFWFVITACILVAIGSYAVRAVYQAIIETWFK